MHHGSLGLARLHHTDMLSLPTGVYVKACTARPDPRKFKGAEEQDQELARQREQVLADLGSLRDAVFSRLVEVTSSKTLSKGHGQLVWPDW